MLCCLVFVLYWLCCSFLEERGLAIDDTKSRWRYFEHMTSVDFLGFTYRRVCACILPFLPSLSFPSFLPSLLPSLITLHVPYVYVDCSFAHISFDEFVVLGSYVALLTPLSFLPPFLKFRPACLFLLCPTADGSPDSCSAKVDEISSRETLAKPNYLCLPHQRGKHNLTSTTMTVTFLCLFRSCPCSLFLLSVSVSLSHSHSLPPSLSHSKHTHDLFLS